MLNWNEFRVLTFDCYGTLIDWENGILNALKPVFIAHHVKISQDDALELFGELESEQEHEYKQYRSVLENVLAAWAKRLGFYADTCRNSRVRSIGCGLAAVSRYGGCPVYFETKIQTCHSSNVDDDLFAHSAKKFKSPLTM